MGELSDLKIKINESGLNKLLNSNNAYTRYKELEELKTGLNSILSAVSSEDHSILINTGLEYFRNEFICRPELYPGDSVYYQMFSLHLKKGLSPAEASEKVLSIIDRNMEIIDYCRSFRLFYNQFVDWC